MTVCPCYNKLLCLAFTVSDHSNNADRISEQYIDFKSNALPQLYHLQHHCSNNKILNSQFSHLLADFSWSAPGFVRLEAELEVLNYQRQKSRDTANNNSIYRDLLRVYKTLSANCRAADPPCVTTKQKNSRVCWHEPASTVH